MTTTELIALLKKHEFGGATGKPRTISFDYHGLFIPSPTITVDSTGDGLITEICLGLDAEEPRTRFDQIRAKSDDEFAEWLSDMAFFLPQYGGKIHSILKLLRKEVTDEEEC